MMTSNCHSTQEVLLSAITISEQAAKLSDSQCVSTVMQHSMTISADERKVTESGGFVGDQQTKWLPYRISSGV